MQAERTHGSDHDDAPARTAPAIRPGALVVLRSPRTLRGTTAIVRREMPDGWEVEVRSPAGTPMHLTVTTKAMLVV